MDSWQEVAVAYQQTVAAGSVWRYGTISDTTDVPVNKRAPLSSSPVDTVPTARINVGRSMSGYAVEHPGDPCFFSFEEDEESQLISE